MIGPGFPKSLTLPVDVKVWRQVNEKQPGAVICWPDGESTALGLPACFRDLAAVRGALALYFRGVTIGQQLGRAELAREFSALMNLQQRPPT